MNAHDLAVTAVVEAWSDVGRNAKHHENVKAAFRREWPTLAAAVERLVYVETRETAPAQSDRD